MPAPRADSSTRPAPGRRFATKLGLLLLAFLSVPAVLYGIFETADGAKNDLLRRSVEQEGRLIAAALRPLLDDFKGTNADRLPSLMEDLGGARAKVKLLFRPRLAETPGRFLYVASSPVVSNEYLEAERVELLRSDLMPALANSCSGNRALAYRYTNPAGEQEILTSVTPLNVAAGCWAILVSHTTADILDSSLGRPYWLAPEVRLAGAIYLLLAGIVIWMFVVIWQNLRRFERFARRLRMAGATRASFGTVNRIPELAPVVNELDRLVASLQNTAVRMRDAAEEHAHALKTPLGVIAQSLEPLRSTIDATDTRRRRAVELIEKSVVRLDALVSAARQMDVAAAEALVPQLQRLDLSRFTRNMTAGYATQLAEKRLAVSIVTAPEVWVDADPALLELMLENLFENAASFSPAGSEVSVVVERQGPWIALSVADRGPGVPPENLENIFERYFSERAPRAQGGADPLPENFGIGLWVVRRNAEAMGGTVEAENRDGGGLVVTVRLPATI